MAIIVSFILVFALVPISAFAFSSSQYDMQVQKSASNDGEESNYINLFEKSSKSEARYSPISLEKQNDFLSTEDLADVSDNATGLFFFTDTLWYLVNGQVQSDYTGFVEDSGNWFYVTQGQVSHALTSIFYGTVNGISAWWYVENGMVNFDFTGLAQNDYGWWYLENGTCYFNFTGLVQNEFGWWYIEDSHCNFNFTGLVQNEFGWWYIEDSHCNFNFTGLVQNEFGWWYIEDSYCNFNFTGLVQNEFGWWYIENSRCNFNFTGLVQNEFGWWYIEDSHCNFNFTGLAENESGKWYVRNSYIDFSYTGLVQFESSWWYVKNGQVSVSSERIVRGTVNDVYGWWYVKNGQVDLTYDALNSGWSISNGQIIDSPSTTTIHNMDPMVDNNSYSGKLFIGDSRVIQLYQYGNYQYYNEASFVTVWGGGYAGASSSINSPSRISTMQTCVQESIQYTGECDVYVFATPNEYNGGSSYTTAVNRVISLATTAKTWTAKYDGQTITPTVYVVELIASKGVDVSGYNSYLKEQAGKNGIITMSISDCLTGSNGGYDSGNLHYNDATLQNIWAKILE